MAAGQAPRRKPAAAKGAVALDGDSGIVGARREEPATASKVW